MQLQASPDDLQPGTEVGGYEIAQKIGQGGMGQVYAATHPVIGKRVAIKTLSPNRLESPDHVSRFIEEARAVNKIGHPNIIDIFSFGQLSDGRHYMVMEYLEGETLQDRLRREILTVPQLRQIFHQICAALEAVHKAGIVHRDLKPANIWLLPKEDGAIGVKLLDFGIAKLLGSSTKRITRTGMTVGTPNFMSPEQCLGRAVDHHADLYSFGIILYLTFTGLMPFAGKTMADLVYRHTMQPPEPPSRHRPLPAALEQVILDCLEKNPRQRPPSARALAERLAAALAGAGVTSALTTKRPVLPATRLMNPGERLAGVHAVNDGGAGGRAGQAAPLAPTPTKGLPAGTPPTGLASVAPGETLAPRGTYRSALLGLVAGFSLVALVAGVLLLGETQVRPEDLDAAAGAVRARLADGTAGIARGFEARARAAAASSSVIHVVDIAKGDRKTLQDFFDDEEAWAPYRAAPLVSALAVRSGVLAMTGAPLEDLARANVVTEARMSGSAAGIIQAGKVAYAVAGARVIGFGGASADGPVVVLGAPLDSAALAPLGLQLGGAVGIVAGGNLIGATGPENFRRAITNLAAAPPEGKGLLLGDEVAATALSLGGALVAIAVFPAPPVHRSSGAAIPLVVGGACLLLAAVYALIRGRRSIAV